MKISFCTTCMDRLFHLEQTYLQSIKNTESYKNKEFILLNYGSKSKDLDDWAICNLKKYNNIKYFKTEDPVFWCAAHAKNICYKQATGDILINLDCDNILINGYCEYISNLFNEKNNIIVASRSSDLNGNNGCCGMISTKKDHFYSVNGYDESFFEGWGVDDTNFQFRCRMHNNLELVTQDIKYNCCISHSNEVRTKNCINKTIFDTKKNSENKLYEIANKKQYIANLNNNWGICNLNRIF